MDRCVIFVHIPRTGGTTLDHVAYNHYRPSEILVLHPATEAPQRLADMTEEERARVRFVRGHVPFGMHQYFPQGCTYITILRDPVERVISLYHYIRSEPAISIHRRVVEEGIDLAAFVERGLARGQTENGQTRLLSGIGPWEADQRRTLDAEALNLAKQNLEGFAALGLTERFDESMEAIQRALGWAPLSYRALNVSRDRPRREAIPAHVINRIEEVNDLDRDLYEHARRLFVSQGASRTVPVEAPDSAAARRPVGGHHGTGWRVRGRRVGPRIRHVAKQVLPFGVVRRVQARRVRAPSPGPARPPSGRDSKIRPSFRAAPVIMRVLTHMREHGYEPGLVIDVGAAHGHWTTDCMQLFPQARYVVVEPLPDYRPTLNALARDPQVTYVAAAAGRRAGRLPMVVPDMLEGASLVPNSRGSDYFKRSVEVPVVRLDDLDLPEGSVLLKLDVQGYELEVLAGAERLAGRAEVIVAECSLYRFQEGYPTVDEVIDTLGRAGFVLYDIGDEVRFSTGVLGQIDLVFVAEGSVLRSSSLWVL